MLRRTSQQPLLTDRDVSRGLVELARAKFESLPCVWYIESSDRSEEMRLVRYPDGISATLMARGRIAVASYDGMPSDPDAWSRVTEDINEQLGLSDVL